MPSTESSSRKILVSVLGTLIASAITWIAAQFSTTVHGWVFGVLHWVMRIVVGLWRFLADAHGVPGWMVISAIVMLALLFRSWFRRVPRGPSQLDYTEDQFEGVRWCWQYHGRQISPQFVARCPICQQVLVYRQDSELTNRMGLFGREFSQVTIFRCENCDTDVARCEGSCSDVHGRVARAIDRKLQTGEWRAAVARPYQAG